MYWIFPGFLPGIFVSSFASIVLRPDLLAKSSNSVTNIAESGVY
jgi:hypothetical protein